jgi:hypothetical protein
MACRLMASAVEIANLALEKIGDEGEINSLDEDSRAARAVNACFAAMRDAVLRAHPWDFARTRASLPELAEKPAGWWGTETLFQKPADFIRFVELDDERRYRLEGSMILVHGPGPLNILYIRRVEDTGRFDPLFVEALAARIAMQVAKKITGSDSAKARAEEEYIAQLRTAKAVNGIEDAPQDMPADDWVLARERGA